MARILIAEDDTNLAEGLAFNLKRAGYPVDVVARGDLVLDAVRAQKPDLLILDLMMPGMSGFDVLERLAAEKLIFPVIVLSAKDGELDKVRGFELGAADYVTKPFSVAELLARVKARLGARVAGEELLQLESGVVSILKLQFEGPSGVVALTPTEIEILKCLRDHRGEPVAREKLLRAIWGCGPNSTRTLDAHVARLRRKIEKDPTIPRHILTVHRVGYRLA